jgi:small-conductance mechanosensitive channel
LPNTIAREREAAVAQVMAELYSQQREMLALTQELRGVLDAGTVTAQSLEELVDSTDRLMARFEPDPDAPKPTEPPRPFDINEYTRTVTELAATAREFQALVQDVDALTPKLTEPMDQLTGRVRDLVDYAFSRALLAILALLLAAIVYQVFANRLKRRTPPA